MSWAEYNAEKYQGWTEKRCELLRKLWVEQGLTATQCAAILGEGMTRNAIIGKVHRLKFPKRKSGTEGLNWQRGDQPAKRARGPDRVPNRAKRIQRAAAKVNLEIVAVTKTAEPEFEVDLEALSAPAWQPLETSLLLPLHALTERTCKWPLGEDAPFTFCGCDAIAGSPYCATHKRRSVGTGTISEQTAHRVKARHLEAVS